MLKTEQSQKLIKLVKTW